MLDSVIVDAAGQFQPEGKDVKDRDIAHLARQTAVLSDLLRIHQRIPTSTRELQQERAAFEHTIEAVQQALYPWITKPKDGNRTYNSFFHLIDSFHQDAGIVLTAGKDGGFRWAVHQIVTLRAVLNSTLPIEVFYGGDEDLPENHRKFIEDIALEFPGRGSITTRDIMKCFPDPDNELSLPGRWALRPFSVLASSFKQVILSDADTIFLQDPRILLNETNLHRYGSLFWHDRTLMPASDETYAWADELLASAKAKYMDRVRDAGWFRHWTYYEMERYFLVRQY